MSHSAVYAALLDVGAVESKKSLSLSACNLVLGFKIRLLFPVIALLFKIFKFFYPLNRSLVSTSVL